MRQIKDRPDQPIEPFIARWQGREGGQERANYVMFLNEFCHTLGLPMPEPAGATTRDNDYVFERAVKDFLPDGSAASLRQRRGTASPPRPPRRQRHFRTKGGMPDEPILRAFHNIKVENAVLQADPVLARDAKGLPETRRDADGAMSATIPVTRNPAASTHSHSLIQTICKKHRIRQIAERLDANRKRVLAEHAHLTLTGLYNVLEKLRAGTSPADLDPADRRIFDDGLVGILNEDHDKLDTAVAAAYGWPADLPETEILTRLVALNKERTQEEAQGLVRWLRPDYQISKFGTAGDKAQLDLGGGTMRPAAQPVAAGPKAVFPPGDLGQTAAVMASLVRATRPLSSYDIAANFRQGRRILPQIEAVLAALVWDGWVSQSEANAGFVLRKAA